MQTNQILTDAKKIRTSVSILKLKLTMHQDIQKSYVDSISQDIMDFVKANYNYDFGGVHYVNQMAQELVLIRENGQRGNYDKAAVHAANLMQIIGKIIAHELTSQR